MPIYEYACAACGHAFEEWQKMSDAPVRTCPKCKKKKVEKLISHTAFQLKGGGWYADLYSSSKPGKTDGKESGSGTGGKEGHDGNAGNDGKTGKGGGQETTKGASDGSASEGGNAKGKDSGAAAKKDGKDGKGDAKDAKKKDSPKKSEARAA